MDVDETKSLAQLTGVDWGPTPDGVGSVVRERYELRRTPLAKLAIQDLSRLLSLEFQDDAAPLVPYCLNRIVAAMAERDEENWQFCRLLAVVLSLDRYDWLREPDLVHKIRGLVNDVCYALYQASDEAEIRTMLSLSETTASLYEKLARFEQRISKVEQTRCSEPGDGAPVCSRGSVAPGH